MMSAAKFSESMVSRLRELVAAGKTDSQCVAELGGTDLAAVKRAIAENNIHRFAKLSRDEVLRHCRDAQEALHEQLGRSQMEGYFHEKGLRVSAGRIDAALSILNPSRAFRAPTITGRIPYISNGVMDTLSLDGNHNLGTFAIYISSHEAGHVS